MRCSVPAIVAAVLVAACSMSSATAQSADAAWGRLADLVGHWNADANSGGAPGVAISGGESWEWALDGRVLVRRDFSEYPAANGRPAFRHEGLTTIAREPSGELQARSYDNEGHVIDYRVVETDEDIVFESAARTGQPRFRLTYHRTAGGYALHFFIADPQEPEKFRQYVSGGIHRAP